MEKLPTLQGQHLVEKVIVVAAQVNHFRVVVFDHLQHRLEEPGVFAFPRAVLL
jgi:hypothetical protein